MRINGEEMGITSEEMGINVEEMMQSSEETPIIGEEMDINGETIIRRGKTTEKSITENGKAGRCGPAVVPKVERNRRLTCRCLRRVWPSAPRWLR